MVGIGCDANSGTVYLVVTAVDNPGRIGYAGLRLVAL